MKKKLLILTAIAICFGVTANTFAQKTKPGDAPVISTIQEHDGNFVSYSLRSDGFGSYRNGTDSTGTIESIFQGGVGDWVLNTLNSSRTVFFDFGNATYNDRPLTGYYPVRFITQCGNSTHLPALTSVGATTTCPLIVLLDHTPGDDSSNLSLRFWTRTDYPGATSVTWTCTAASSGKCTNWQALSSNDNKLTAQLLERKIIRNKITDTPIALYSFSFDIALAKQ